jgi:hypothetical protein
MARWANVNGQPRLLRRNRRRGGAFKTLYQQIGEMPAEEAQKAVERGPSPQTLWFETQVSAEEAAREQHRVDNRLPELSRAEQEAREEAARAADERVEIRRAADAAYRHQADAERADLISRALTRTALYGGLPIPSRSLDERRSRGKTAALDTLRTLTETR